MERLHQSVVLQPQLGHQLELPELAAQWAMQYKCHNMMYALTAHQCTQVLIQADPPKTWEVLIIP